MPGELNLGTMYTSLELRTTRLEQSLSQAVAKFDTAGKTIETRAKNLRDNIGRPLEDLGRTFSLAVSAPLLGLGVAAVKAATQMDSLKRGLVAVSGSSQAAEVQLKRLNEVAKLPGLGLKEAIQGSINLQAAGFSAKQAERSLMAFGNALATVGKGKAELDRVNLALTQLANKTTGFGQDIRQLQEALPQIRTAMMRAFGTADTEIIAKAGITGKQFVDVITKEFERLPKVTGGIQNSFENLQDQIWKTLGELGKTLLPAVSRATDELTTKLQAAANWWKHLSSGMQDAILKGAAGLIGAGGLLFALGKVVSMVTVAIEAFKELRTAILGASLAGVTAPGAAAAGGAGVAGGGVAGLISRFGGGPAALASGTIYGLWQSLTQPGYVQQFGRGMGTFGTPPLGVTAGPGANLAPLGQPVFNPFGAGIQLQPMAPEDPQVARYRRRIAALTASENAKKVGAAARRAQAAEFGRQRFDLAMQEAMGMGWQDPEQLFKTLEGIQRAGHAETMGKGLAAFAQQFVAAVANTVVSAMTGRATTAMGGAVGGMGGAFANALGWRQNEILAAERARFGTGMMGTLQAGWGGMMGVPGTATAAAQKQVLRWMENAFGAGGPMWDQAKIQRGLKRGFEFMPDLAANLADEFAQTFSDSLAKAFGAMGKNPVGRALARTIERWLNQELDWAFQALFRQIDKWLKQIFKQGKGGGGQVATGENAGQIAGNVITQIGIGMVTGGLGSFLGFQSGGIVPGPAGRARLAVVHGGEVVLSQQQTAAVAAGGITVNLGGVTISNRMDAAQVGREIAWQIQRRVRTLPGG